jgi:hypothetical protein
MDSDHLSFHAPDLATLVVLDHIIFTLLHPILAVHPTQLLDLPSILLYPACYRDLTFSPHQPLSPTLQASPICQICSKKGHTTRECWHWFDAQYGPLVPPQAFTAQSLPSSPAGEWYLDSGATYYVTSDLNNLSNFTAYDGHDTLQIGNGAGMIISHIGSFIIHIANHQINLHNILHVSSFTKNLLSLSQLLFDNSLIIEFSSNACFIKDRLTSTPLLQAKLHNGLYSICIPMSFPPQAFLGA